MKQEEKEHAREQLLNELTEATCRYNRSGKIGDLGCLAVAAVYLGNVLLGVYDGDIDGAKILFRGQLTQIIEEQMQRAVQRKKAAEN